VNEPFRRCEAGFGDGTSAAQYTISKIPGQAFGLTPAIRRERRQFRVMTCHVYFFADLIAAPISGTSSTQNGHQLIQRVYHYELSAQTR